MVTVYIYPEIFESNGKMISGFGVHGYIYKEESIGKKSNKKPNKLSITSLGYLTHSELLINKVKELTPDLFIDYGLIVEENIYEAIVTYIQTLFNKYGNVSIRTHDRKLMNIFKEECDFISEMYNSKIKKLKESKSINSLICYSVENDAGLNRASLTLKVVKNLLTTKNYNKFYIENDPKYYWTPSKSKNDFIISRHMIFRNTQVKSEREAYCLCNYKKDDPIGLKTNYVSYYQYLPHKSIEEVEYIKSLLREQLGDNEVICNIHTENLYNKNTLMLLNVYGFSAFISKIEGESKRVTIRTLDGTYIGSEIKPVGVANAGIHNCSLVGMFGRDFILHHILKRESIKDGNIVEITDYLYNEKGIKPEIKDKYLIRYKFSHNELFFNKLKKDVNYRLKLICGYDIPDRNTLKRIEKKKPRVFVIIRRFNDIVAEHATVIHIEETDEIVVWTNIYSNKTLIK